MARTGIDLILTAFEWMPFEGDLRPVIEDR